MRLKSLFNREGELSSLITKKDIYDLANTNLIVGAIVSAHEHGNLDWSSALALMVFELAKANSAKEKMLLEHLQLCATPIFRGEP